MSRFPVPIPLLFFAATMLTTGLGCGAQRAVNEHGGEGSAALAATKDSAMRVTESTGLPGQTSPYSPAWTREQNNKVNNALLPTLGGLPTPTTAPKYPPPSNSNVAAPIETTLKVAAPATAPSLTPERLAESLPERDELLKISENEWASIDETTISIVVSRWLHAKGKQQQVMASNAANAALIDAARRDIGQFDPQKIQHRDPLMLPTEQQGHAALSGVTASLLNLELAITRIGPRTAPALLAAGEREFISEKFGDRAIANLANAANDSKHDFQAHCWLYCRQHCPLALSSGPPVEKLLSLACNGEQRRSLDAINALSVQPEKHLQVAELIQLQFQQPRNQQLCGDEEYILAMLRLKNLESKHVDWIRSHALANLETRWAASALVALATSGDRQAAEEVDQILLNPQKKYRRDLYDSEREYEKRKSFIRFEMVQAIGAMGSTGQKYVPALIGMFKTLTSEYADRGSKAILAGSLWRLGKTGREFVI